jgi:hypothetical protein
MVKSAPWVHKREVWVQTGKTEKKKEEGCEEKMKKRKKIKEIGLGPN